MPYSKGKKMPYGKGAKAKKPTTTKKAMPKKKK